MAGKKVDNKKNDVAMTIIHDGKESAPFSLQQLQDATDMLPFKQPIIIGIDILKAKIVDEMTVDFEYTEVTDIGRTNILRSSSQLIHPDLIAAFDMLSIHLAIMCEYVPDRMTLEEIAAGEYMDILDSFFVNGFRKGGHDEFAGVVLIGGKRLKSRKVTNLVSPFEMWEVIDGNSGYKFISELHEAIDNATKEVEYYLKGKCAAEQLKLDV